MNELTRRSFLASTSGIAAVAATSLPAFAADSAAEKGKAIVNEALEALGGEKFLQMKDRIEEGRAYSFYREQLAGLSRAKIYTRYLETTSPKGLAVRERQVFGKDEDNSVLIDENAEGWEITFRGARPLPEAQMQRYLDSTPRNILYLLRKRLKEPGMIIESAGSDVLVNEPVNIVEFTDSANRGLTVYFHYSTKLPIRQKFFRRDPQTKERFEEVTLFSKFRGVGGGVKWPYAIRRERDGEKIFEIFSEKVVINQDLNDSLFMLPADLKRLKP
jgi:hypothetical protein